jgi:hypothetical protein
VTSSLHRGGSCRDRRRAHQLSWGNLWGKKMWIELRDKRQKWFDRRLFADFMEKISTKLCQIFKWKSTKLHSLMLDIGTHQ